MPRSLLSIQRRGPGDVGATKFHPRPPWGPQDRKLSKEAVVLQDYLGRCPTRTSEGLFPLALGYVSVDTPLTEAEIEDAFAELSEAKLFDYDLENEVALDRRALIVNPLRHPRDKEGERKARKTGELLFDKRIPNAVRVFSSVPDSPLKIKFVALADLYSPDLADAIREESTYAYSSPSQGPSKDHASTIEGPSKDHGRTIEGPSREETSSYEESQSREESRDASEVEEQSPAESRFRRAEGVPR